METIRRTLLAGGRVLPLRRTVSTPSLPSGSFQWTIAERRLQRARVDAIAEYGRGFNATSFRGSYEQRFTGSSFAAAGATSRSDESRPEASVSTLAARMFADRAKG